MDYKEIVDLWEQGRSNWRDYEFEVGRIGNLIFQFFEYKLGIEEINKNEKYLKKYPEKDSDSEKLETTLYSAPGCVEFKKNGWATFCLRLLVEINENTWPKNRFTFTLNIKKADNKWLVKLCSEDTKFFELSMIPDLSNVQQEERLNVLYSDPGLIQLWEEFCKAMRFQTIDNLQNWLSQEDK